MNPVAEVGLVVARELRKNLRSAKGLVLLLLSLLGGIGTALALVKLRQLDTSGLGPEEQKMIRAEAFARIYGDADMGKYLADAPVVLLMMFALTIWLGPLLVALVGFDAVSGEVQHRAVRFWAVRVRRSTYYLGKFFGVWAVVCSITFAMSACIWIVTVARGEATFGEAMGWGMRLWGVSVPIAGAWCGLGMLVASQFRTPILALLVLFATFFGLWIVWIVAGVTETQWLTYVYPNSLDMLMLSPKGERAWLGLGGALGYAGLLAAAGAVLFERKDV
jgi:ABC-type transport system involved in multi-copper enzyme maturation permease subunit